MVEFFKYQGTGNDFIVIDNRNRILKGDEHETFAALCHRRFGIGADGVLLLNQHPDFDFEMHYVNSDGYPSSMCGNGGRCIVRFAQDLGIVQSQAHFLAIDGPHEARIERDRIALKMALPRNYQTLENGDHWLDTGSPHYVRFLAAGDAEDYPVVSEGRRIRNSPPWSQTGTNVNFVWGNQADTLQVRTYERGVEDETYSCGTGVTAVAETFARTTGLTEAEIHLKTPGGSLSVQISENQAPWLIGPAELVFSGHTTLP